MGLAKNNWWGIGGANYNGCAFTNCLALSRNYEKTMGDQQDMRQCGDENRMKKARICGVPLFICRHFRKY